MGGQWVFICVERASENTWGAVIGGHHLWGVTAGRGKWVGETLVTLCALQWSELFLTGCMFHLQTS